MYPAGSAQCVMMSGVLLNRLEQGVLIKGGCTPLVRLQQTSPYFKGTGQRIIQYSADNYINFIIMPIPFYEHG